MLKLESITKRYGAHTVLDAVSFTVEPGQTLVITGPSGSGKTTLLRVIAGLTLPDSGQVSLDGEVISQPNWGTPPHTRGMGFVFQNTTLWPHLTVSQNISFGLHGLPKSPAAARVRELLQMAGIADLEKRRPAQLSGGEARRVELLRAIAPRPAILLMDEPLTNLDSDNKTHLLEFIQASARTEGNSLIYVTHDAQEAAYLSDNVMKMTKGRLQDAA